MQSIKNEEERIQIEDRRNPLNNQDLLKITNPLANAIEYSKRQVFNLWMSRMKVYLRLITMLMGIRSNAFILSKNKSNEDINRNQVLILFRGKINLF